MSEERPTLWDVTRVFLKLGTIAFGGPAVHIAMMREEFVHRRRWISEQQFLDLLGAANLIPGPSSTELAIYIGYRRAGRAGLIAAGVAFILPAMLIVTACGWGYVTYGGLPAVERIFYGLKPVLIAIVGQALWGLGRVAIKDALTAGAAAAALVLALANVNVIGVLLVGGGVVMLARRLLSARGRRGVFSLGSAPLGGSLPPHAVSTALGAVPFGMATLFVTFLKIGAILFGSGYVLLAFLRADFVVRLGWLTDRQLLDAVAVGQFTPGPVFTTATFIGYLLGGLPGALVATVGIFLPSFLFVAATYPFIPRLRASVWTAAFLDGVNAISLALMAAVTWHLARAALVDPLTVALGVLALGAVFLTKVNSALLVLAGGLAGLLAGMLGR
jgi:chromate transporter